MHTCGHLTQLAAKRGDRAVLRCTCGALHLVWENATVQLYPDDLSKLLQVLRLGRSPGTPFHVVYEGSQTAQVWLYNVALRLYQEDLETLTDLLQEADAERARLELPTLAANASGELRVN
jgi:hypothetical protein